MNWFEKNKHVLVTTSCLQCKGLLCYAIENKLIEISPIFFVILLEPRSERNWKLEKKKKNNVSTRVVFFLNSFWYQLIPFQFIVRKSWRQRRYFFMLKEGNNLCDVVLLAMRYNVPNSVHVELWCFHQNKVQ